MGAENKKHLHFLQQTMLRLVRGKGRDLSARQLSVLLEVYLNEKPQTVRGLAALLEVNKPSICRALDRLGELDLARRKPDLTDRRSISVMQTLKGIDFMRDLGAAMAAAVQQSR